MSVREKLLVKLASRARVIATVASLASLYLLCIMPIFSNTASVEEDTIYPGGTLPFVKVDDFVSNFKTFREAFARLELPHFQDALGTEYTVSYSNRDDGREGLVYVFMGLEGGKIGLALANALRRVAWLSKDVYFVFPKSAEHLTYWFDSFYRSSLLPGEKPILRGAFVLELFDSAGPLEMSVEGPNGLLPNEDWGNVLFEVAGDLGIAVAVRPLYESIMFQALNGGIGKAHSVFLNYAIPAISIARSKRTGLAPVRSLQVAQLVGRHLRAIAGAHLQLHHSTSWYFYTGPAFREISMGLFLPLLIGLLSPLIVAVVDLNGHTELPVHSVVLMAHVVTAVLFLGGFATFFVIAFYGGFGSEFCQRHVQSSSTVAGVFLVLFLGALVVHLKISVKLKTFFDSDPLNKSTYSFSRTFKATIHEMYCVILVALTILHWSLAFILTLLLLPMLLLAPPFVLRWQKHLFAVSGMLAAIALFALLTGEFLPGQYRTIFGDTVDLVRTTVQWRYFPTDLARFVADWSHGRVSLGKPLEQHVYESVCQNGMALPGLLGTVIPGIVLAAELFLVRDSEVLPKEFPAKPWLNPRRQALIVLGVAMMAYQVYYS